jgi:hypothetical protein
MIPIADNITSSCNPIKPMMNTKKIPVKKEEVPVFLKKVSTAIWHHAIGGRAVVCWDPPPRPPRPANSSFSPHADLRQVLRVEPDAGEDNFYSLWERC